MSFGGDLSCISEAASAVHGRLRPCPRDLWATRARKCALTPTPARACLPQAPQCLWDAGAGPVGSLASFPHHGHRATPATASPLRCVPGLPQAAFSLFCPHGSGFPWLCVLFQWLPSAPMARALSSTSPPFSLPSSLRGSPGAARGQLHKLGTHTVPPATQWPAAIVSKSLIT